MNRRAFMTSTLAAPLASAAVGRRVRIGFLGGSHSHAKGKLDAVLASGAFEFAGMWDEDREVRQRFGQQGVRQISLDELLSDESIDVIAVESAVRDHARHGMLVLEAGKHLHLEKPPALDVESLRTLLNLAGRKNLAVQMGYMWRHHPGLNAMLEAARQGWLGDVHMVRAIINKTPLDPGRRPEWAEFRGGHMFELGPHVIDPMVRLMGRPNRVTPFLANHSRLGDNLADNTMAVLEFPGAFGIVMGSTIQHRGNAYRSFEIQGSLGTATLRPIEPPVLEVDLAKAAGPYAKGRSDVPLPPYKRYVEDFVELAAAVRGERAVGVTAEEDIVVQEVLIRASDMG